MKKVLLKIMLGFVACGIGGFVMTACGKDNDKTKDEVRFIAITGQYNYTLEGTKSLSFNDSDFVFCDSVDILLPEKIFNDDISMLRDSIIKACFDTVGVDVRDIMKTKALQAAVDQGYPVKPLDKRFDNLTDPSCFVNINGSVTSLSSDWLSYCVAIYSYMAGAAHGESGKFYLNYLPGEGKMVTLDDIFTKEGLDSLPGIIAKEADSMTATIGETSISSLPSDNNFFLSPAGEIVFVYQPYEVASYAQGFIQIPFYPYELSDYMTKAGHKIFKLEDLE